MKLGNFEGYERCLENCSLFELEELGKNQEYEDRFIRFLRYIEILEASDPRKEEGKKLITRIYDLDKFKNYQ